MIAVDVQVEAQAWTLALPNAADVARRAAMAAAPAASGEVAILLADDETLKALNARLRGKDAATNVLAFPAAASFTGHLGDVALAFGVCLREAREQGKSLTDHLSHLVVHGVLHVLGYDHHDEAQGAVMEARERDLLAAMGVSDPYAAIDGQP